MNQIKTQIPLTSREAKARTWSKLSKLMVAVILLAAVAIFITSGAFDWLLDTIAGKSSAAAPAAERLVAEPRLSAIRQTVLPRLVAGT